MNTSRLGKAAYNVSRGKVVVDMEAMDDYYASIEDPDLETYDELEGIKEVGMNPGQSSAYYASTEDRNLETYDELEGIKEVGMNPGHSSAYYASTEDRDSETYELEGIKEVRMNLEQSSDEIVDKGKPGNKEKRAHKNRNCKLLVGIAAVIIIILLVIAVAVLVSSNSKVICEDKCFVNDGACIRPGICKCPHGRKGNNCEYFICNDTCHENEGECVKPGICKCPQDRKGYNCEDFICEDKCFVNDGACVRPGICKCPHGRKGNNCEYFICNDTCHENEGECVKPGICKCPQDRKGYNCEDFICEDKCFVNDGACVRPGICKCPHGRKGNNCEYFICNDTCHENEGECVKPGICKCPQDRKGYNCEDFICEDKCVENEGECVGPGICKCPPWQHGYNCEHQLTDCYDIQQAQRHPESGVYQVLLKDSNVTVDVFCDMDTDGGGWSVFQNRFDGSVNFNRNFTEYVDGFGKVNAEFWLGLENIYRLISHGQSELRIDMSRANGIKGYTTFRAFSLSAGPDYELRISRETAGNLIYLGFDDRSGLYGNDGASFSTYDRDRDTAAYGNCASSKKGGWWYSDCTYVNLNGLYCTPGTDCGWKGMYYLQFAGYQSLKTSRMMVRRHHSNK